MGSMRNLFILAGNGPYENRGCEAIVRGTVKILSEHFESPEFLVHSHFMSHRQLLNQIKGENDQRITHKGLVYSQRCSPAWVYENIIERLSPQLFRKYLYRGIFESLPDAKAVLSIGGDNYSLDYGKPTYFLYLNELAISKRKPLILWGASVGPFSREPEYEKIVLEQLRKAAIFARETETIRYLISKGLKDNVFRVADPAFLMAPKIPPTGKLTFKIEEGAIGINLSPLMAKYVTNGDMKSWVKRSAKIIELVSAVVKRPIYLIPHVTLPGNDDHEFMETVFSLIDNKGERIMLVPPVFNAEEMKWLIGKMYVFAGARMHSVIAALSSGIPALSFSYSLKGIGVIYDIFGSTHYCLRNDEISADIVCERLKEIIEKQDDLTKVLKTKYFEMRQLALDGGRLLKGII